MSHTPVDDRRDSPRVPMRFQVRNLTRPDSPWKEVEGDLGVGGAYFRGSDEPKDTRFELTFRLPDSDRDLRVEGELLYVTNDPGGKGVHLRFVDLDVDTELTIARYFHSLNKDA